LAKRLLNHQELTRLSTRELGRKYPSWRIIRLPFIDSFFQLCYILLVFVKVILRSERLMMLEAERGIISFFGFFLARHDKFWIFFSLPE